MEMVLESPVFTGGHLQIKILNLDTRLQACFPWPIVALVQMTARPSSPALRVPGWPGSMQCLERSLMDF